MTDIQPITGSTTATGLAPVTILGLGPMGQALAGAFLTARHPTTVWNRSPGKDGDLLARGAAAAATAADAVAASPLVIICVLDYDAVQAVLGTVGDALRGRTLVNLTADLPARARETAAWAADHGVDYLDGSIMTPTTTIGGPGARVNYSGPAELYAAWAPTLARLGGTSNHLGTDPGRAAAYDIALLDFFWTSMSGFMHALALARAEGVTAAELAPHAKGIAAIMPDIIDHYASRISAGEDPEETATLASATTSVGHLVHASAGHGLDTAVLDGVAAHFQRALDSGDDVVSVLNRPTVT
ncbi:3-hydroxyisobutyrate dehydrogenase-like beta-hydroxyacid dehydrogenase [Actinoalloteichus hoggarensis]|nr:NAD(P)-binding domain-containing protein [Actinoalloteichus hoggarensis]MBB5923475.1 3-hydroxyisobutyrate dehydrogenase-like beta-hydroxyacid dehydrogenase [Actinoalloteichus hoggarensis]